MYSPNRRHHSKKVDSGGETQAAVLTDASPSPGSLACFFCFFVTSQNPAWNPNRCRTNLDLDAKSCWPPSLVWWWNHRTVSVLPTRYALLHSSLAGWRRPFLSLSRLPFLCSQLFSLFQPFACNSSSVTLSDGVSGVCQEIIKGGGLSRPAERLSFNRLAASIPGNQSALIFSALF